MPLCTTAKARINVAIPIFGSLFIAYKIANDPRFLHVGSENSDQTEWMPRMIRVPAKYMYL